MTVSATYSPPQYVGNGVTTVFGFGFQFFAAADLTVNLFDTAANANVAPQPVLNGGGTYDYTVVGVQDVNTGEYLSGAAVTFNTAPLGNHRVTITRQVARTQPSVFTNNAPFPAKTAEGSLDRATLILQELDTARKTLDLQIPSSDTAGLTVTARAAALRAGNYLAWDVSGNLIDAAPAIANTLVSAAMAPVVTAGTLALAKNQLDIPFSLVKAPGSTPYAVLAPADIGTVFSSALMGGAGTFTLPAAATAGAGATYAFVRKTNNLTLNRAGGDVIQGIGATFTTLTLLSDGDLLALQSDGAATWKIVSASPAAWAALGAKQPTRTVLNAGNSGNYVPPAGVVRLDLRMCGGGGGGAGSGSAGSVNGGNGGNATFGALTANGGSGATASAGGPGAGLATGGDINAAGASGENTSAAAATFGGAGGTTGGFIGGPGVGGQQTGPGANATGFGHGGGGGGGNAGGTITAGGGGGAGAALEKRIVSPAASYAYALGAGGTAGLSGTGGTAGGGGAPPIIIIDEYYY